MHCIWLEVRKNHFVQNLDKTYVQYIYVVGIRFDIVQYIIPQMVVNTHIAKNFRKEYYEIYYL